ncbi:hypothetical protein GLOTRDRAFT_124520 [Gloeophyllum trabeum ATCC 11539]|uniref:Elongator complex protein 5 n=1 Tax=Gloeophyllum trabeum (strain ATCC 11539 / FP-39264 / Madison 617) TaxID=670483 RepID=S7QMY4_GLOTA|nr:uncharacterized protein GLOTRDRAFT_124520 [Gloeophyllum trabeum ATCC 11539]EPQ60772.1 hypothetical protein GLOTRDRAFT_124520 [Gloeophyllum trabeum ATCC 11539]
MPLLLPSILSNTTKPPSPVLLLESSLTATCLPLLRAILSRKHNPQRKGTVLLICLLYPPSSLVGADEDPQVKVLDRTGNVPGYDEEWTDPREEILNLIKDAPPGPLEVIIDSADTLAADLRSVSATTTFLSALLTLLESRPAPARLTLHLHSPPTPPSPSPTPLLPLLAQTRFSPALTHLTAHPPALLAHIAAAYLTPPPPLSAPERFFRVFAPLAARRGEVERLVLGGDGAEGEGEGEAVVEVVVRSAGGRRGVERVLEGWKSGAACSLAEMDSLRRVFARKGGAGAEEQQAAADPAHGVPFNLSLTPEQQQARARVPLPYAHEGTRSPHPPIHSTPRADHIFFRVLGQAPAPAAPPGAIYYDPDSADDIDDDDPDEDLDI